MKKKLGEHCPKMVRWYGSSIEDQEFPIPGKMSSLGCGDRAVADEDLREVSMHILIRQSGKPYQEEITAFHTILPFLDNVLLTFSSSILYLIK
jgi:hypothetical protein